jgi:3-ketosteroid 9alpha-monooxygenase subunit A
MTASREERSRSSSGHGGWQLLAFRHELTDEITPLTVGRHRLIALRDGDEVRVFDGSCPHRGAHLGYGGVRAAECIVCPFHGRRIRLGGDGRRSIAEHRVLLAGEAIFIRLGDDPDGDRGFEQTIKEIAATRTVVAAARQAVSAPASFIVENAFDVDHFAAVHRVPRVRSLGVRTDDSGVLAIEAEFRTMVSPWAPSEQRETARSRALAQGGARWEFASRFHARAFSPGLVITEFGPPDATHYVITGAVVSGSGCVARVAVAVLPQLEAQLQPLIAGAGKALAEDLTVWDHLDLDLAPQYDARDEPVLAYREFCAGFPDVA